MENQNQGNRANDAQNRTANQGVRMAHSEKPTNQIVLGAFTDSESEIPDFALLSIRPGLPDQLEQAVKALEELADRIHAGELALWGWDAEFSFHKHGDDTNGLKESLDGLGFPESGFLYVKDAFPEELPPIREQGIRGKAIIDVDGYVHFRCEGMFFSENYWTESIHYKELKYVTSNNDAK